jgi:hypothetical protein
MAGHWAEAQSCLTRVPDDGPSKFLLAFITHHRSPPSDWDGVIKMTQK